MSIFTKFFDFDIQLFGEGAGAAAGGGDGGTGAGDAGAVSAEVAPQQKKGVKNNPLADVVYGKQDEEPAAEVSEKAAEPSEDDRNAQFEKFISENKDLYNKKVNEVIRQRHKGVNETVEKYQKLSPMLAELAKRYGTDSTDIDGILKGFDDDTAMYEAEAAERGMDVHQLMEVRKMQRDNDVLQAKLDDIENRAAFDRKIAAWQDEGAQLKQIYPNFNFEAEMQNPEFFGLLQNNVPMRTAFEVLHKDEIYPAIMHYAAQQSAQKVANNIAAGQKRPNEGAMAGRPAVKTKSDVSQLTKADREEIARRVARGEKIRF